MITEKLQQSKQNILNQAIENFKKTKKGGTKILVLIKEDIKQMDNNGDKIVQQLDFINDALSIEIKSTTYRSFYYRHIRKKESKKKASVKTFNSRTVESSSSQKKDIFADLKN